MFFAKIYAPVLAAIALLIIAFRYRFSDAKKFTIKFFGAEIDITNKNVGRVLCIATVFSLIPYYVYIDFSRFFPDHFEMEVFYDSEGVKKSMSVFSKEDLSLLRYRAGNEIYAEVYYKKLDQKLKQLLRYEGFFSLSDRAVHSKGETSFKVVKVKKIHNYYIESSKGELSHILERPQHHTIQFKSFFDKLPSADDYIRPSLWDIFVRQEVLFRPRFKQVIAEQNKSDGVVFDHTLVGATKVYLFPYPSYSNTVYFFDFGDRGLVPIGYAVYK